MKILKKIITLLLFGICQQNISAQELFNIDEAVRVDNRYFIRNHYEGLQMISAYHFWSNLLIYYNPRYGYLTDSYISDDSEIDRFLRLNGLSEFVGLRNYELFNALLKEALTPIETRYQLLKWYISAEVYEAGADETTIDEILKQYEAGQFVGLRGQELFDALDAEGRKVIDELPGLSDLIIPASVLIDETEYYINNVLVNNDCYYNKISIPCSVNEISAYRPVYEEEMYGPATLHTKTLYLEPTEEEITIGNASVTDSLITGRPISKQSEISFCGHIETLDNLSNIDFQGIDISQVTDILLRSVSELGNKQFSGLTNLRTFKAPNVKKIGSYCFANDENLIEFECDSLEYIEKYGFQNCKSLECSFENIRGWGEYAFENCEKIKRIASKNISQLSSYSLTNSFIEEIELGDDALELPSNVFYKANYLHKIVLPSSLEKWNVEGFWYCSNLDSLIINDSEKHLKICDDTNYHTFSLDKVYSFSVSKGYLSSKSLSYLYLGRILDNCIITLSNLKDFIVSEQYATSYPQFYKTDFDSIVIHKEYKGAVERSLFACCNIGAVIIEDSENGLYFDIYETKDYTDGCHTFNRCNIDSVYIGRNLYCDYDKTANKTRTDQSPFYLSSVKSVRIGGNCNRVPRCLFYKKEELGNLYIGSSVSTVEERAFYYTTGLKKIVIEPSDEISPLFFDCLDHPTLVATDLDNFILSRKVKWNDDYAVIITHIKNLYMTEELESYPASFFYKTKEVGTIYVPWETPLWVFEPSDFVPNINKSKTTLVVPNGSKELYLGDSYWQKYGTIKEIDELSPSAVGSITEDGEHEKILGVYDVNGVLVSSSSTSSLAPGIYVVKNTKGTRKIVVH